MKASYAVNVGPGQFHELRRIDPKPQYGEDYKRRGGGYIEDQDIKPVRATNGNRKAIRGFTRRSKRNFRQRANAHPSPLNGFQTATCPDDVFWAPVGHGAFRALSVEERAEAIKRHLAVLGCRVAIAYPGCSWLWVVEWEKRKTGDFKGDWIPHVHIMWSLPFANCEADYIPFVKHVVEMWIGIIGTNDPNAFAVHFTKIRKGKKAWEWLGEEKGKVLSYVTKYTSKAYEARFPFECGRMWGVKGAPKKDMLRTAELPLTD